MSTMNASGPNEMYERTGDQPASSSHFIDPRLEKDFDPNFYPQGDGAPVPSLESAERDDRSKVEFCAVYYRLNRLHARLTESRREVPASDSRERDLMEEIEKHLRHRDELEDRYAPYGVIAEPVAQDGYTVNVRFTFGDQNVLRRQRMHLVTSTALLFFHEQTGSISREDGPCKS